MPAYYGETANSCALDRCMARAKELMHWDENIRAATWVTENPFGRRCHVHAGLLYFRCGCGSITLKLNDDGFYTMMIGASDMGTGCDTTLAQIAADVLGCDLENIVSHGVDTDVSPYDSGSYASSTAYLTGMAAVKASNP